MNWIRHTSVCRWGDGVCIGIDAPNWGFGIKTHEWGWRLMLFRWHLCLSFRKEPK